MLSWRTDRRLTGKHFFYEEFPMSGAQLLFFWSQWKNRLWFYPALCSLFSVIAVLGASLVNTVVPPYVVPAIDIGMLNSLLTVIAMTMLTISTFSLSILHSTFSFTSGNASPRATEVLVTDNKAHEAISAFIAAFIFALVAIMALGLGYYNDSGRLTLLLEIIGVLAFVILAFLRWLRTLSLFGRLDYVVDRVEDVADAALRDYRKDPYLGCRPGPDAAPPGTPLYAEGTGYVQDVDRGALNALAERLGATIHVRVRSGMRAHPALPVAVLSGAFPPDADRRRLVAEAFPLGRDRILARDPGFGLKILAEIAQRALSNNDPGTAVRAVDAAERVLIANFRKQAAERTGQTPFPHLTLAPLHLEHAVENTFSTIVRQAPHHPEVMARLGEALNAVADNCSGPLGDAARAQAARMRMPEKDAADISS